MKFFSKWAIAFSMFFVTVLWVGCGERQHTPTGVVSGNSSTDALDNGETYTGTWTNSEDVASIVFAVNTDQSGTLYFDQSPDGVNVDSTLTYAVTANINEVHRLTATRKFFRLRFVNDSGSNQTHFRLQAMIGQHTALAAPANLTVGQDADAIVTRSIPAQIDIAQGKRAGHILIHKYGNNSDVDTGTTPETIWEGGGLYGGFPTATPELVEVVSSSTNDSSAGTGCRTIKIWGLDSTKALQEETITLNGTTPVDTVSTYSRVYRAKCITVGSTLSNVGVLTVRWTTTTSVVFAAIPATRGQTAIAVFTVPLGYKGYMLKYGGNLRDSNTNRATYAFVVQTEGQAKLRTREFASATDAPFQVDPYGGIEFEEKTDIECRALSVTSSNGVLNCFFDILLVKQ